MKLLKKCQLLFVLVLLVNQSFSQKYFFKGYIIDLKGDTVKGLINYQNLNQNPDEILFKKSDSLPEMVYHPVKIKEFVVGNDRYISRIVWVDDSPVNLNEVTYTANLMNRKDTVFLQVLVSGDKSLYSLRDFKKDHFYIEQNGEAKELNRILYFKDINNQRSVIEMATYKGQLISYFATCPSIHQDINKMKYQRDPFIRLFLSYYKINPKGLTYQINAKIKDANSRAKKRNFVFEKGVVLGGSYSKLVYEGDYHPEYTKVDYPGSSNLAAGAYLNVLMPWKSLGLSLYNELLFSSFKSSGTLDTMVIWPTHYEINFNYKYLKLNILLRYKYLVKNLFVFVNGGITRTIISAGDLIKITETQKTYTPTVVKSTAEMGPISGFVLGCGIIKNHFSLEYRFEKGHLKASGMNENLTRNYILLGYRFGH